MQTALSLKKIGTNKTVTIRLMHSGKLSREKISANWWKIRFSQRKLSRIAMPKMPHPQILQRKLSRIAKNCDKLAKVFSLKIFPQYGMEGNDIVCYIGKFVTWKHYNACQLPMIVWSQVNTGRDEAIMLKNSPFMVC